jgi:hypothetical protein
MICTFVACKESTGLIREFESNMTESMPIIFVTAKADFMHAAFVLATQRYGGGQDTCVEISSPSRQYLTITSVPGSYCSRFMLCMYSVSA